MGNNVHLEDFSGLRVFYTTIGVVLQSIIQTQIFQQPFKSNIIAFAIYVKINKIDNLNIQI